MPAREIQNAFKLLFVGHHHDLMANPEGRAPSKHVDVLAQAPGRAHLVFRRDRTIHRLACFYISILEDRTGRLIIHAYPSNRNHNASEKMYEKQPKTRDLLPMIDSRTGSPASVHPLGETKIRPWPKHPQYAHELFSDRN